MTNNINEPNGTKKHYRNIRDIISLEGEEIDAGALWELQDNNILFLEDEDTFASAELDSNFIAEKL